MQTFTAHLALIAGIAALSGCAQVAQTAQEITEKPDLSGTYNIATLTPLQRPEEFGDREFVSEEEAKETAKY